MAEFTVIAPKKKLQKLLNVAAYARVSTEKDSMLHSLNKQVDYYRNYIAKNPLWKFSGIYADYAVTGTKESRKEFDKLLEDARSGKIDLIVTKSVARFARNLLVTVGIARELKALNVDIFFEEQNVHSISKDGELMLSLVASFAQRESYNASEHMKWRVRKEFEQGHAWQQSITGYKFVNGSFEVIPEEAETVRKIYSWYLEGNGLPAICKKLDAEGITSKRNCKHWNINSVRRILTCYTYTGNLILQTTYKNNHLDKIKTKNRGELKMFHVKDDHEAIIPLETWNKVQEEFKIRDSKIEHSSKKERSLFAGLLVCSHCGKHYTRKVNKYGSYYICPTFSQKGKEYCCSKQVREEPLIDVTKVTLGKKVLNREDIEKAIQEIVVCDNNILLFKLKDGTEIEREWKYRSRSESWTPEMKAKAAIDAVKKGKKQNG